MRFLTSTPRTFSNFFGRGRTKLWSRSWLCYGPKPKSRWFGRGRKCEKFLLHKPTVFWVFWQVPPEFFQNFLAESVQTIGPVLDRGMGRRRNLAGCWDLSLANSILLIKVTVLCDFGQHPQNFFNFFLAESVQTISPVLGRFMTRCRNLDGS